MIVVRWRVLRHGAFRGSLPYADPKVAGEDGEEKSFLAVVLADMKKRVSLGSANGWTRRRWSG